MPKARIVVIPLSAGTSSTDQIINDMMILQ